VIAAAQRADLVVYTINAHKLRLTYPGDLVLQRLAGSTGGRAFLLPSYSRIHEIFPQLESELGAQYTVTFRPRETADRSCPHRLRVAVNSPSKVQVRARSSYYLSVD
jgi:Ca-activated chloride channel family protein